MDYYVLETKYGITYGSTTLKSLQNENMPELDLLVREAIQNSSDASLQEEGKAYSVAFNTGKFNPQDLNKCMTGIETSLNARFQDSECDFLEIRDSYTSGLTGSIYLDDISESDHGNYFKLIFDTGKQQNKKNAGGNWGFGKSVYYRVGIGIVVFYSRIKVEEKFESRLIITMVENEDSENAFLKNITEKSAGKAWWGKKREGHTEEILPITDEKEIADILSIFSLSPYSGKQTGTSAIIPYIDRSWLLENVIPLEVDMDPAKRACCLWADSLEEYLDLAIQRWYAPKVMNKNLQNYGNKKMLRAKVNDNAITFDGMYPFFKLVQELYTTAVARCAGDTYKSKLYDDIICKPVNIMKHFDGTNTSGFVAMIKISHDQLNGGENYLPPYYYTRHFEPPTDKNETMVMFTRDPGMVIDYQITGAWLKGVVDSYNTEEYIFAFYVPRSDVTIRNDFSVEEYAGMELGEYLRGCEASDHKEWFDKNSMTLVTKIKSNTANNINRTYDQKLTHQIAATPSKLSGTLGKRFLPRMDKKKTGSGGSGGSGGGGSKLTDFQYVISTEAISGRRLTLNFNCILRRTKKELQFDVQIDSESGWIDKKEWDEKIGTEFPVSIKEICIYEASNDVRESIECPETLDVNKARLTENDFLRIELANPDQSEGFRIKTTLTNMTLNGKVVLETNDKIYSCSIKAK